MSSLYSYLGVIAILTPEGSGRTVSSADMALDGLAFPKGGGTLGAAPMVERLVVQYNARP
jgi:hypothetical protein